MNDVEGDLLADEVSAKELAGREGERLPSADRLSQAAHLIIALGSSESRSRDTSKVEDTAVS